MDDFVLGLRYGRIVFPKELFIEALVSKLHVVSCGRFLKFVNYRVLEHVSLSITSSPMSRITTFCTLRLGVPELGFAFLILQSCGHDSFV